MHDNHKCQRRSASAGAARNRFLEKNQRETLTTARLHRENHQIRTGKSIMMTLNIDEHTQPEVFCLAVAQKQQSLFGRYYLRQHSIFHPACSICHWLFRHLGIAMKTMLRCRTESLKCLSTALPAGLRPSKINVWFCRRKTGAVEGTDDQLHRFFGGRNLNIEVARCI